MHGRQHLGTGSPGADPRAAIAMALAGIFWLATCTAQVIAPALLGWKSGIGVWIARWEHVAALLSQLALVGGCTFAFWMLLVVLRESRIGIGFRIGAAPLAAAIITSAIAASTQHLAALLTLGLSLMVGFLALAAAWSTARSTHTRGLGLALGLVGLGAGFATMARLLALRASAEALTSMFLISRALATATHLLGIAAFVIGAQWVIRGRCTHGLLVMGVPILLGAGAATATQLSAESGSDWLVLLGRFGFELGRNPFPLLPTFIRRAGDAMLLLGSGAVLFGGERSALGRAALCLALLPRGGTDIPLLALALALASLLGPLSGTKIRQTAEAPKETGPAGEGAQDD
jgi:hypothetical protein